MKIIVITGPPYSGKGTQCEIISRRLGLTHISTGDRCRLEKENKTAIGLIMSSYEEKGDLVPDQIMKTLFSQIVDENKHHKGIILDGYPRTLPQVDDLLDLVAAKGETIAGVINIEVPKEELLARALNRAATSSRKDDQDSRTHLKRLQIFEDSTLPAISYMKTRLSVTDIDGLGAIEAITKKILALPLLDKNEY